MYPASVAFLYITSFIYYISKVHYLSKSEAQQLILDQSKPKEEGAEVPPSNPEKRPITDIRNQFEDSNIESKDNDKKKEN